MGARPVLLRLNQLLYCPHDEVVLAVLRLLYNLSFDGALQHELALLGMIPRVRLLQ